MGPICPLGADWAQLQEALFPRAYNLHMAFCDGLQNRKGLISPASHHGIHSAVCRVYEKENSFLHEKRFFGYGRIFWIWPYLLDYDRIFLDMAVCGFLGQVKLVNKT